VYPETPGAIKSDYHVGGTNISNNTSGALGNINVVINGAALL
jgi:hypothetical protein